MIKKNIILVVISIIVTILLCLVVIGITPGSIFRYFSKEKVVGLSEEQNVSEKTEEQIKKEKEMEGEKIKEAYNEQFPDVIKGIITITSNEKATITTEEGQKYLIWPSRPKSFYKDSGIENNELVEVRGKILENNQISLGYIIPAK